MNRLNRHISQIAGLIVIAIAVTVLVGWQFDISIIKSGFPFILATMKANTAICFLFAGISLTLLSRRTTRWSDRLSQGLAGAVIAISLLTLSEYFFGWDLQIDQLLFRDVVTAATPYAGRMGINTAFNFVLIGTSLLLLGQKRQQDIGLAHILSSIVALISLSAFFEYIFHVNIFEKLVILSSTQAIHTIFSFLILYIGILWLYPEQGLMQVFTSSLVGGKMARHLLPWTIIFPVVLNWLSFQGTRLGWYNSEYGYMLRSILMILIFLILIWGVARFLNQIDLKRQKAQVKLKKLNETLEILIKERTESLEKSNIRLAGILDIADDAIISVDSNQRVLLFNQGAEKLFGYTLEDILGQPLDLLLSDQSRNNAQQHIQQFVQSSSKAQRLGEGIEILGRRQDGREFPVEASISKLEMANERVLTIILRDISDRRQIEIALQNSEEQFRHAFEDASIGMAILSLDGHWLRANSALCEIIGYSPNELLSLTFQDITHPDDFAMDFEYMQQMLAGERTTCQREKRYLHKQGQTIWVLLNCSLIKDNHDNPLHFIAQIQDITVRRESQKTLELQSIIMNNMAGGVCLIKSADLTIGYTNPKFDKMFGYAEGELSGQHVGVINYVDTEVTPDVTVQDIATQIDRDGEAQYEVYNKKKDGTLFWCRVHTSRFEHPEYGTVYVAVQEDVTELKLAEKALQKAKESAEMANLAKSMFLSNMSHELRTPLNAILGFTELMSYDTSLSPENQEDLAIVNRSGKHLLELINDILDLSKIESGQMRLNLSDFDLESLLTSLKELFQVQAQAKELQLIIDLDPTLPKYIYADKKKLYQVLVNLLGNALKFTHTGSVILRVRQQGISTSNRARILFEVEDTGVGISPEEIDSLFQVFVQAQAGNQFNQGTGLGLAISQKFIQLMGSRIRVHSRLDHGSIFSFELRVTLSQSVPLQANLVKQRVIGLASGQPKYRILIVEDLEENRCLLTKILTSVGFEVREATQGVEALALWESWSPHLIWMDLLMPVMDGYTTIKHIREHPHGRETIIIALTASVLADNEEKALIAGCNDFVGKPFQENHIFDKIAQHLGVQYIYANSEEKAQPQSIDAPSQEELAMMPTQWLEQMYQAAYYLDSEAMNLLITQIPESNAGLSKSLTYAIANFNTDRIIDLIRPLLTKPTIL